jgi:hypothetical protein
VIGAWERALVLAPHTDDGEFACGGGRRVEGAVGNREVSPLPLSDARGDRSGAGVGAFLEKEGGSWGKHGFPPANEPASVASSS